MNFPQPLTESSHKEDEQQRIENEKKSEGKNYHDFDGKNRRDLARVVSKIWVADGLRFAGQRRDGAGTNGLQDHFKTSRAMEIDAAVI